MIYKGENGLKMKKEGQNGLINKRNIKRHLTEGEQVTAERLGINRLRKLIKGLTKKYNSLCNPCRDKLFKNPRRDIKEYCENCQEKLKEVLGKFTGGGK